LSSRGRGMTALLAFVCVVLLSIVFARRFLP
jgi:hypothetical protein